MKKNDHILLVDDDPSIVALLEKRLSANGFRTSKANNGKEALTKISECPPDLILLDIMMPQIDGIELKKILNKNIETQSIPVLFLTAKGETADKIKGLELGVDDYIAKPYNANELLARINSVLDRRKLYEKISMSDSLTGLYNVNFFKKQINIFFQMAKRYGKIFSLGIIDINDFKPINDTYGHQNGDVVLRQIAQLIQETVREADIVMRYGGDEFVVIFPEVDEIAANNALSRCQERVGSHRFILNDNKTELHVSISYGYSTFNKSLTSEAHMFAIADDVLYQQKKIKNNDS